MGELYIADHVKTAAKALDLDDLEERVDLAYREQRIAPLYDLHLSSCGAYVSERLRRFERELENFAKAKAARKREETKGRAWSAGSELRWAVRDLLQRIDDEEKERELVRVDDVVSAPYRIGEHMEARVGYQWRRRIEDDWSFGSITFVRDVDMRPDFSQPPPRRKPSRAAQEREREDLLYRHWEQMVRYSIHAVHDFLKAGGDGTAIPDTFLVKTDGRSRWLDNFSCRFWQP